MKTVLGFRYLIFKLLLPRICMRDTGAVTAQDLQERNGCGNIAVT